MTAVTWSPRSLADLESIHSYIAADSVIYADLVIERLVAATERLVEFPEIGRIVPEIGERVLREVIAPPFRLVYRLRSDGVEIITVFRSSRLFPADFEQG